jgi:membrane associated rhomboid family serine protease
VPRLSGGILGFPDFRGFTRQLVLWNLAAYFLLLILGAISAQTAYLVEIYVGLIPAMVIQHGFFWQIVTYWIIHQGIINTLFELLSIWFLAAFLEAQHGARWLGEIFFFSVIGCGLAGLALAAATHSLGTPIFGCWGGIFGLLIAFGVLYADMEFMMFPLPFMIKAKYLVAVYMLLMLAMLFFSAERIFAFAQLGGALFGYLYIKLAPRRGFAFAGTESLYGMRNRYYRWKRRRAAKKFEVYMRRHRDN